MNISTNTQLRVIGGVVTERSKNRHGTVAQPADAPCRIVSFSQRDPADPVNPVEHRLR